MVSSRVRSRGVMLAAALGFSAAPTLTPAQVWPTYQVDPHHSGHQPVSLDAADFWELWSVDAGEGTALNPVSVAGGQVFTSTNGRFNDVRLLALDTVDGNELWRVDFGDIAAIMGPAVAGGRVYVQTGDHTPGTFLRCYDATTGGLVFQAAHAAQWEHYLAPTVVDGVAYINGGYYGGMYAFDADDGTELWYAGLPQYDEWTPAVDATHAYAYMSTTGLHAVNRMTGTVDYTIEDPDFDWRGWSVGQAVVLDGAGGAYVTNGGRLIRFDLASQSIDYARARNFSGQVSIADGVLYSIDSSAVTAWHPTDVTLQWTWAPPADTLRAPILVTDTHLFVCGADATYAVNLATHAEEWSHPSTGALAIGDGKLFIASSTGQLTAIDLGLQPLPSCPPDGSPGPIRDLEVRRAGLLDLGFSWSADPAAVGGYHGYRLQAAEDAAEIMRNGLRIIDSAADPAATGGFDRDVVFDGNGLLFYQVLGVCGNGAEGPR